METSYFKDLLALGAQSNMCGHAIAHDYTMEVLSELKYVVLKMIITFTHKYCPKDPVSGTVDFLGGEALAKDVSKYVKLAQELAVNCSKQIIHLPLPENHKETEEQYFEMVKKLFGYGLKYYGHEIHI